MTRADFERLVEEALRDIPRRFRRAMQNVAVVVEDEPSPELLAEMGLGHGDTLLGLYEGTPLPQRQGMTRIYPDKITLFRGPLSWSANTPAELKEAIKHTLWHEIAHYYGLDHDKIRELE